MEKQIAVWTPRRFARAWEQSLQGGWKWSLRPGCPRASLGSGEGGSRLQRSCIQTAAVLLGLYQGPWKPSQQGGICEPFDSLWPGPSLCLPMAWPEQPNPDTSSMGTEFSFSLTDEKPQISSSPEKSVLNVPLCR